MAGVAVSRRFEEAITQAEAGISTNITDSKNLQLAVRSDNETIEIELGPLADAAGHHPGRLPGSVDGH